MTSPLKPNNEDPTPKQKPTSPPNPSNSAQAKGRGNLKRFAREKGKQAQGEQVLQKAGLSGSKRLGKLEFPDDIEGALPQKRMHEMHGTISCNIGGGY